MCIVALDLQGSKGVGYYVDTYVPKGRSSSSSSSPSANGSKSPGSSKKVRFGKSQSLGTCTSLLGPFTTLVSAYLPVFAFFCAVQCSSRDDAVAMVGWKATGAWKCGNIVDSQCCKGSLEDEEGVGSGRDWEF